MPCVENNLIEPDNSVFKATLCVLTQTYCIKQIWKLRAGSLLKMHKISKLWSPKTSIKVAVELFRWYLAVTTICCTSSYPFS